MNARSTHRPHMGRVYPKPRRRAGGSPPKKGGCPLALLLLPLGLARGLYAAWVAGGVR